MIDDKIFVSRDPVVFRDRTQFEKLKYCIAYNVILFGFWISDKAFEEVATDAEYGYCDDCQGRY